MNLAGIHQSPFWTPGCTALTLASRWVDSHPLGRGGGQARRGGSVSCSEGSWAWGAAEEMLRLRQAGVPRGRGCHDSEQWGKGSKRLRRLELGPQQDTGIQLSPRQEEWDPRKRERKRGHVGEGSNSQPALTWAGELGP